MSTQTRPLLHATVIGAEAMLRGIDGTIERVLPPPGGDVRATVVARAKDVARGLGEPVELVTSGDRGEHRMLVATTGELTVLHAPESPDHDEPSAGADLEAAREEDSHAVGHADTGGLRRAARQPVSNAEAEALPDDQPGPTTDPASSVDVGVSVDRVSFIQPDHAASMPSGFRGVLYRAGFAVKPTDADLARAEMVRAVSAHWPGYRTIAVVNGKGGVGKTPTTAMLAAIYARFGGGGVLAFDNNDTRGALGWRTEQAGHDATIRELLHDAPRLLEPRAAASDIAGYVHHQAQDRYEVLRSNPRLLAADQRLTTAEFDQVMHAVIRYFRVVIFDSGNDESADRWLRMIDWSGQIVVPTIASPESAESAALLLEALAARDEAGAALARNAVVVTHAEPAVRAHTARIVETFANIARHVAVIPFDPALKSGSLRFEQLRTRTQDAWIDAAAAAVAQF